MYAEFPGYRSLNLPISYLSFLIFMMRDDDSNRSCLTDRRLSHRKLDLEFGHQTYDMNISSKEQTVGRFIECTAQKRNTRLNLNANKFLC
jgi:hypothetical protein